MTKVFQPDKYRPEYDQMLTDFFTIEPFEEYQTKSGDYKRMPVKFPTLARFAININVYITTLKDWADSKLPNGEYEHPSWRKAFKLAKLAQEDIFTINALQGISNTNVSPMIALNLFGWHTEKTKNKTELKINDTIAARLIAGRKRADKLREEIDELSTEKDNDREC